MGAGVAILAFYAYMQMKKAKENKKEVKEVRGSCPLKGMCYQYS